MPEDSPDPITEDVPRVVRRPGRPRRSRRARRVVVGLVVVAAVVLGAVGAGALWGLWSFNRIERVDLQLAEIEEPSEPRNYLVVGSDSRENVNEDDPEAGSMLGDEAPDGQRADSLMIARVDPSQDRIDILSVPRDLWVTIAGTGKEQRINAAYGQSAQAVVDTVQESLGIPINNYVEVDFHGFSGLIESLGGVPVYFSHAVRDRNSGLFVDEPGCRVLNGSEGLAFARARHLQYRDSDGWVSDPTGDMGRMSRQQLLTRAAMEKAQTLGLGDVGRLKGLVDAAVGSVRLDSTLGAGDLMQLGRWSSNLDPERIQTHSLSTIPHETSGKAKVALLDAEASESVLSIFRGDTTAAPVTTTIAPPPEPGAVTIDVVNAMGKKGEAGRVSFVMVSTGGFAEGEISTADQNRHRTTIEYPPNSVAMAELAARWLMPYADLVEEPDLEPGTVRIILGEDFESVSEPSGTPRAEEAAAEETEAEPVAEDPAGPPAPVTTEPPGWVPSQPPQGITCG